jgi:hypothetical protein
MYKLIGVAVILFGCVGCNGSIDADKFGVSVGKAYYLPNKSYMSIETDKFTGYINFKDKNDVIKVRNELNKALDYIEAEYK